MRYLLLSFLLLTGCATFDSEARRVVNYSGTVVAEVDAQVAQGYTQASGKALEESTSLEQYQALMADWNAAVDSLSVVASVLYEAEALLDAWQAGLEGNFLGVVANLLAALLDLLESLQAVGVEVPRDMLNLLSVVEGFLQAFGDERWTHLN